MPRKSKRCRPRWNLAAALDVAVGARDSVREERGAGMRLRARVAAAVLPRISMINPVKSGPMITIGNRTASNGPKLRPNSTTPPTRTKSA
jgi:hypothetical protein